MTQANAELKEQVEELYDYICNEENGNAWEQDFMLSIWKQFIDQGRSLSAKQIEKIEELYDATFDEG